MTRERALLRGAGAASIVVLGLVTVVLLLRLGRPIFARPVLAAALFVAAVVWAWMRRERWWHASAELGLDGVAFGGRKGKLPRFLRWSDVRDVSLRGDQVLFHTSRGPIEVQPLDPRTFATQVQSRLEAFRRRDRVEVPHQLLAEDPDEGVYRQASLPSDVLVRVATDPSLDDELRALAAELAARAGERGALEELAEETADPAMRAYLDKLLR